MKKKYKKESEILKPFFFEFNPLATKNRFNSNLSQSNFNFNSKTFTKTKLYESNIKMKENKIENELLEITKNFLLQKQQKICRSSHQYENLFKYIPSFSKKTERNSKSPTTKSKRQELIKKQNNFLKISKIENKLNEEEMTLIFDEDEESFQINNKETSLEKLVDDFVDYESEKPVEISISQNIKQNKDVKLNLENKNEKPLKMFDRKKINNIKDQLKMAEIFKNINEKFNLKEVLSINVKKGKEMRQEVQILNDLKNEPIEEPKNIIKTKELKDDISFEEKIIENQESNTEIFQSEMANKLKYCFEENNDDEEYESLNSNHNNLNKNNELKSVLSFPIEENEEINNNNIQNSIAKSKHKTKELIFKDLKPNYENFMDKNNNFDFKKFIKSEDNEKIIEQKSKVQNIIDSALSPFENKRNKIQQLKPNIRPKSAIDKNKNIITNCNNKVQQKIFKMTNVIDNIKNFNYIVKETPKLNQQYSKKKLEIIRY